MTHFDHSVSNLLLALASVYPEIPAGMMRDDCRSAILDAYDRLRDKYGKLLAEPDADRVAAFHGEQNRA